MKVIIAGSRSITEYTAIKYAVDKSAFKITEVVSGCARGVDKLGERWAKEFAVPIKPFPAKWTENGYFDNSAGFKRNEEMAKYADALIAIWDGNSKGTANMMHWANRYNLKVFTYYPGEEDE